ncbi:MAG: hypothetical protein M1281_12100 [Chloroflexi bacterium]|nr:hypothetical protein [Chloroflexota bacterium]
MRETDHRNEDLIEPISGMENRLQMRLTPVRPDPEFVDRLRKRLTSPPDTMLEPPTGFFNIFLVLGIVSGSVLALTLVLRLIILILDELGVFHPKDHQEPLAF